MRIFVVLLAAVFLAAHVGLQNPVIAGSDRSESAINIISVPGSYCPFAKNVHNNWSVRDGISMISLKGASDYIPCYKSDSNSVKEYVFRYCPTQSPWTPTNSSRNFCYATSEDCARAEMPQSWCIKCGK